MLPRYSALLLFPITLGAQAQIVFEYEDLPVPGDVLTRYVDTLPGSGPGGNGPNQFWDFGDATPHVDQATTVMLPSATPFAASFTGSNLAYEQGEDNYGFFNASPSALITTGLAGDPLGTGEPIVITLNPTLKIHDLPRTHGDHFTDNYYFEVIVDGSAFGVHSVRLRHYGNVFDSCDAYGSLTTPVGTYNALRVKSTEFSTDSIWIRLLAFLPWQFVQALEDTSTAYSWLAKETKLPVAELTLDTLGNPARLVYSALPPAIGTGVTEGATPGVRLWPVPATDGFILELDDPARFRHAELVAADGRVVRTMGLGDAARTWFHSAGLSPGAYLVRCVPRSGQEVHLRMLLQ